MKTSPLRPPEPRQVRVITTTQLGKIPAAVVDEPDLPYAIIIIKEGATYYQALTHIWDRLSPPALSSWVSAWGLTPEDNPWDHIDPNQVATESDIKPPHRLPKHLTQTILTLI